MLMLFLFNEHRCGGISWTGDTTCPSGYVLCIQVKMSAFSIMYILIPQMVLLYLVPILLPMSPNSKYCQHGKCYGELIWRTIRFIHFTLFFIFHFSFSVYKSPFENWDHGHQVHESWEVRLRDSTQRSPALQADRRDCIWVDRRRLEPDLSHCPMTKDFMFLSFSLS